MMKRGTRTMRTALLATSLALLWGAAASAENYGDRMTRGKLQADLGDHQAALQEFDAIAAAEGAPASLRGEARVRLGLAKRALGDEAGSAEAFE